MRKLEALLGRYLALCQRRTKTLLALFLGLFVVCLYPISQFELRTDMAELLPAGHEALAALRQVSARQRSSTNLVVLLESPDRAANQRCLDALLPELTKMVPRVFSQIDYRPDSTIPDYAARWRWLYAEKKELLEAEELLDRIIAVRTSPLMVDLDGDAEAELKRLRAAQDRRLPERGAPYFVTEKEGTHVQGILLWRRGGGVASMEDQQLLAEVEAVIKKIQPTRFHPQLKVEYTGTIGSSLEEHDAVRDDLTSATGICISLVLLVIYLYFRRLALLPVIGAPAFLGLFMALAVTRYTVGHLNMNTAFLLSIILGNGINSPIVLLARYGEERQRGQGVEDAMSVAMLGTLLGTFTAMCAASIAYGSLLLTDLRGLSHFGFIGGGGMLLVWVLTFLLVPPMVFFGERLRPGLLTPRLSAFWLWPFALLGRLSARHAGLLGIATTALLLGAVLPLRGYLQDPMEWRLERLRTDNPAAARKWGLMYRTGIGGVVAGYIATDGVILVERPALAEPVAEALRQKDRPHGYLKAVRTLESVLPQDQDEKLLILNRIRAKLDRHHHLLSDEEWRGISEHRPPEHLRKIGAEDLPKAWLENFTEVDGQRGRFVGIDCEPAKFPNFDGRSLILQAHAMNVDVDGRRYVASSFSTVFSGILEIILRDRGKITAAALIGVLLLSIAGFGLRGSLPVLLSVLIGMVWLGGLLAVLSIKLNFVNFVALPITLGIGADYAANIWARLRREGTEHIEEVVRSTGSAVALCSMTTIIGYSSLLKSSNRALQSFGMLADLGEVTCLIAALLAMPALVRLFRLSTAPKDDAPPL